MGSELSTHDTAKARFPNQSEAQYSYVVIVRGSRFRSLAVIFFMLASCVPAFPDSPKTESRVARKVNIPGVKDAGRIDDSFYRGAQPSKKGLKELRKLGVNTIIDLRGEWPWEVKKERKEAESLGMSFINLPGNGWTAPSDREVAEFFKIIQERPRRRIFVHCWLGGDRSGVFIAIYRIAFDGWTSEAAIREMRAYHFKAFFHPNMTSYVRDFPERLVRSPELAPFRHTFESRLAPGSSPTVFQ